MKHFKSEVVSVTPDLATKWLESNLDNRNIRQSKVDEFAGAMKRGEWKITPQGIIFGRSGRLLDGQHRLWAAVQAGVTVELSVATDVDDDVYDVLDIGTKRSVADLYGLDKRHTEIANLLARMYYSGKQKGKPTPHQVKEVGDAIEPYTKALIEHCGSAARYFSSVQVRAAAVVAIARGAPQEYVLGLYAGMVRSQWHELPPVCSAFNRQVMDAAVRGTHGGLFARACVVFDPDNAKLSRVLLKEGTAEKYEKLAKDLVGKLLKKVRK